MELKFASTVILESLFKNDDYLTLALPYLKEEYFENTHERLIFKIFSEYISRYNKKPTIDEIGCEISDNDKLSPGNSIDIARNSCEILAKIDKSKATYHDEWLIKSTEEFCKHQALFKAIQEGIETIDQLKSGKKNVSIGQIEDSVRSALSVTFDNKVGHDYLGDYAERWKYYSQKEQKIPFGLTEFDQITQGGLPAKTLTVFLAGPNVGKSAVMCSTATSYLKRGFNVLYVSLEMSEEMVSKRIDANLLDIDIDEISNISLNEYQRRFERVQTGKKLGKLFIKKYPTSGANVNHFRALINEIEMKKGVKIDIMIVDYMGICASSRMSMNSAGGSYGYVKAISEELRGLSDEKNLRLITGAQTNRKGSTSTDLEMDDVAESFGINATADLIVGVSTNEEHEKAGQFICKVIKNRFGSKKNLKRFTIGFDESRMRLYDLEDFNENSNTIPYDPDTDPVRLIANYKKNMK